ncbi:MAG: zinc and cadmium transporter [Abditibacteriota bacterium]|nr:zinc and cadmium transporter [Abditibacteriota bacterium]
MPTLPSLRTRFFESRLSLLIGFSAGLMLATALHELLPEALEKSPDGAMWGAAGGFLSLYIAERLTHFHACRHRRCDIEDDQSTSSGAHDHDHHHQDHPHDTHAHGHVHHHVAAPLHGHADTIALVGMSIHNFADGLTTAAAFAVSQTIGVVVVLAIVLHQLAAGLSLGAIMLRAGRRRRRVLLSTTLSASCILWGALFYHFVLPVGPGAQGVVLGIAGGSFLYVAACDLLPEAHASDEGWSITATTLLGYAFAIGAKVLWAPHSH